MNEFWRDRIDPEKRLEAMRERMMSGLPVAQDIQVQILKELQAIRKLLEEKHNA